MTMPIDVLADVDSAARRAAAVIASEARAAIAARGRFVVGISGGRTPWIMLRALSALDLPWEHVDVVQVDERIAPAGHSDRNLTHLLAALQRPVPTAGRRLTRIHPMPVDSADLDGAPARYAQLLADIAGSPPVLDLVHLGLGVDGHTASLIPGDPVLGVTDADVSLTGMYQGRRRMTLTYPILNRARRVLWLITGEDKAAMLGRLLRSDPAIPAGHVRHHDALLLTDRAAAGQGAVRATAE